MTENPVTPYPLRASEFIRFMDIASIEQLPLSDEDQSALVDFEKPFFEILKPIRDIEIDEHVIYPEGLTHIEGRRMIASLYFDTTLFEKLKGKTDKECDEFFDATITNCSSDETFQENLKQQEITLPESFDVTTFDIVKEFHQVDLPKIPERIRRRINKYSSEVVEAKFFESFKNANGQLSRVENPNRVGRVVNTTELEDKIKRLREFKKQLKATKKDLTDSPVDQAREIVCNLYQKFTNILLANTYSSSRLEEQILARHMEKIDHFIYGTGTGQSKATGLRPTSPYRLSRHAMARFRESEPADSKIYTTYNAHKLDAEQAAVVGTHILKIYGFDTKGWTVFVDKTKRKLSVDNDDKILTIPHSFDRGLIDTLVVLAHEIEGHVLRHVNRSNGLHTRLKILQELGTGRTTILSEAGTMIVEDNTKQEMVGVKRIARPYHFIAVQRKQQGGSFRACYKALFKARAQREYNKTFEEALGDNEIAEKIHDLAYSGALRVFKAQTPLNDTSGYIASSELLDYIEQELLDTDKVDPKLKNILYAAGISLYSLDDLIKIGALDIDAIAQPRMVVAREVWPQIKNDLDGGITLEEIVSKLKAA